MKKHIKRVKDSIKYGSKKVGEEELFKEIEGVISSLSPNGKIMFYDSIKLDGEYSRVLEIYGSIKNGVFSFDGNLVQDRKFWECLCKRVKDALIEGSQNLDMVEDEISRNVALSICDIGCVNNEFVKRSGSSIEFYREYFNFNREGLMKSLFYEQRFEYYKVHKREATVGRSMILVSAVSLASMIGFNLADCDLMFNVFQAGFVISGLKAIPYVGFSKLRGADALKSAEEVFLGEQRDMNRYIYEKRFSKEVFESFINQDIEELKNNPREGKMNVISLFEDLRKKFYSYYEDSTSKFAFMKRLVTLETFIYRDRLVSEKIELAFGDRDYISKRLEFLDLDESIFDNHVFKLIYEEIESILDSPYKNCEYAVLLLFRLLVDFAQDFSQGMSINMNSTYLHNLEDIKRLIEEFMVADANIKEFNNKLMGIEERPTLETAQEMGQTFNNDGRAMRITEVKPQN